MDYMFDLQEMEDWTDWTNINSNTIMINHVSAMPWCYHTSYHHQTKETNMMRDVSATQSESKCIIMFASTWEQVIHSDTILPVADCLSPKIPTTNPNPWEVNNCWGAVFGGSLSLMRLMLAAISYNQLSIYSNVYIYILCIYIYIYVLWGSPKIIKQGPGKSRVDILPIALCGLTHVTKMYSRCSLPNTRDQRVRYVFVGFAAVCDF